MAYSFTAASLQSLSVPDTASLDITGQLTLACWAKSSGSYADNRGLVSKYIGSTTQRSYVLYITASGFVGFALSTDGTFQAANVITGSSAIGTDWAHVAAVVAPSSRQEIFVNAASGAVKTSSVLASIHSGTAPLLIGQQFSTTDPPNTFDGLIAEVGIWSAALSAEEIKSLAADMTCDKVRGQSLVFYAPLIRSLQDLRGGLSITNNNTATVANHPRVYA
jgi:hypothetical protein